MSSIDIDSFSGKVVDFSIAAMAIMIFLLMFLATFELIMK
jgi:hypothetical protein